MPTVSVSHDASGRRVLTHPEAATMTRETLVRRASDLIPTLRERAPGCEAALQLLPETVRDFAEAGFFRIVQPKRFGGFELGLDVMEEVVAEVGRGCGSSAWTLAILCGHAWWAAMFPEEGQQEIFGEDGHVLMSTTLTARARMLRVEGGYEVSGRCTYQTGCDVANWHCISGIVEGTDEARYLAVRAGDGQIQDDWHVLGLRGTGSKSVVFDKAFVPEHRSFPMRHAQEQTMPGASIHPNPLYSLPATPFLFIEVTGTAVGIAHGAVDALDELARTKRLRVRGDGAGATVLQMEQPALRYRLAEAKTLADTAKALLLSESARLMQETADHKREGRKFERDELAEYGLYVGRVVDLCVRAVDHCFAAAGTSATFDGQPIERCWRDIHQLRTHNALRLDFATETWGLAHFGISNQ